MQVNYLIAYWLAFGLCCPCQLENASKKIASPEQAAEADIDGDDSGDSGDDMMDDVETVPREEEKVELTADQQADLDDGWGVVVKSTRGRVKQVMPGQE